MNHQIHAEAQAEFLAEIDYYSGISPRLGERFYSEIVRVIREICAAPKRFRAYDPPARRHIAQDFPFAVVYLERDDHIWILAIMPLRREPDYWKHRLDTGKTTEGHA